MFILYHGALCQNSRYAKNPLWLLSVPVHRPRSAGPEGPGPVHMARHLLYPQRGVWPQLNALYESPGWPRKRHDCRGLLVRRGHVSSEETLGVSRVRLVRLSGDEANWSPV